MGTASCQRRSGRPCAKSRHREEGERRTQVSNGCGRSVPALTARGRSHDQVDTLGQPGREPEQRAKMQDEAADAELAADIAARGLLQNLVAKVVQVTFVLD